MSFGIPVRNGLGLGLLASTSLATGNVGNPALDLPFALTGTLDPRITFSRPSLATMYDSTGKLTYAPNNLLLRSEEFDNAAWSKINATVTANATTAPDGATTADLITSTVAGGFILQNQSTTADTTNYIYSVYIKNNTATTDTQIFMETNTPGNTYRIATIVWSGATLVSITGTVAGFTSVGNGWYRVYILGTNNSQSVINLWIRPSAAGTASMYAWGAQLEAVTYQTTPSAYNATTSAAYYGPRFDYNPATLVARGLLIEEARTNICLRSEDFTTTWSVANATITANSIVSPDGVATADTWTSALTVYPSVFQTITVTNAVAYTATFYAKAGTSSSIQAELRGAAGSSPDGTFDLSTGVATVAPGATGSPIVSMVSVGNGWYRCAVTKTSTSTSFIFIIGQFTSVIGNTVYLWGAQLEAGSFATSYIPTAASAVARSADSATMTGANFSSWYNQTQGTLLAQFAGPASGTCGIVSVDDDTANEQIRLITSGTDPKFDVTDGGSPQADIDVGTVASGTSYKFAGAFNVNDFAACIGGGVVGTDTSGTLPTVDRMRIGSTQAGNVLNGHIASIAYYNTRLPNATLQSLTT